LIGYQPLGADRYLTRLMYQLAQFSNDYDSDNRYGKSIASGNGVYTSARNNLTSTSNIERVEYWDFTILGNPSSLIKQLNEKSEYRIVRNSCENRIYYYEKFYKEAINPANVDNGVRVFYSDGTTDSFLTLEEHFPSGVWDETLRCIYQPELQTKAIEYVAALYQLFWERTHASSYSGNDFTIVATSWTDENTDTGNKNGFPEGMENDIDLTVRIKNNSSSDITNVQTTLTTTVEGITITDGINYYDNVPANGTTWGDGKFRLDLGFDQHWGCEFNLTVSYTKGGYQYSQDISFTKDFPKQGDFVPLFIVDRVVVKDTVTESVKNNEDGIFQSNENIAADIYLKNVGNATAAHVEVMLSNVRGDDGTYFEVPPGNWKSYNDLAVYGGAEKQLSADFVDIDARADFTGIIKGDITIKYGSGGSEQVIRDQVLFNVQPESWLKVSPSNYEFGVSRSDTNVTTLAKIENYGSSAMTVTAITTSNPDTTWTGQPLPWTLLPGESKTIQIQIQTANLRGMVTRNVIVTSTGKVKNVGVNDRIVISGTVGNSLSFKNISSGNNASKPDISGDWVVYSDARNGNPDIFAYQISTAIERQITSNPGSQGTPFISGNLIVWEDRRNWNGQTNIKVQGVDIYGYDLSTGLEFAVSADPMTEALIGVDGNRIIISRVYDVLYKSDNTLFGTQPHNLLVFEYLGNGQVAQRYTTGWTAAGHTSHQTVGQGDFNNGMLIINRNVLDWSVSTAKWETSDYHLAKIDFNAGDTSIVRLSENCNNWPLSASTRRFACTKYISGNDQVFLWDNGTMRQITTIENGITSDILSTSGNYVIYEKDDVPGMYFVALSNQNYENVLMSSGDVSRARMDGNSIVWEHYEGGIDSVRYAFLGKDISLSTADIELSKNQPWDNTPFHIAVTVRNNSSWPLTESINVDLYDGDPDSGGQKIGTTQTIAEGIHAQGQYTVIFQNILLTKGEHNIFAKCSEISNEDYKTNNIASKNITVALYHLAGDVNGDRVVDMADAILALQILSRETSTTVYKEACIDGDGIIGLPEALYIMQKVAGIR